MIRTDSPVTSRFPSPRRRARWLAAVGAAMFSLVAASLAAAPVQAAPQSVGPGVEIEIRLGSGQGALCTLGFVGTDGANQPVGYTAGHCGSVGNAVYVNNVEVGTFTQSVTPPTGPGGIILDANAPDWGVITFNQNANVVAGDGNINPTSIGGAAVGDRVCSQGRTTGYRCGEITSIDGYWINTTIVRDRGDSGGPLIREDGAALGLLSSTSGGGGFGTGSLGGNGGGAGSSRYFSLTEAVQRAGDGHSVSYVNESVPDSRMAPRNIPAPNDSAPAELPSVA